MTVSNSDAAPRRGGIPRGIARTGPAVLSYGFRPFFLGAGVFAVVAMVLWLGTLIAGWPVGTVYGGANWHGHELVFGYATAALAGFMLTAIPNWTGRLPVSGLPLALLFILWLAGRLALIASHLVGVPVAGIIDGIFLPVLAAIAAREIIAGRNWKNVKVLFALCALSAANFGFHVTVQAGGDPVPMLRAGVAVLLILIMLVGGRVVPSFTRNWLARQGAARLPRPFGRLDIVAITTAGIALALWVVVPARAELAIVALPAALLQFVRLVGWRGYRTLREPLVSVLHAAYLFVPLGLLSIGLAALGWLTPASALHVLTVGAIGTMTLAIMTRATLGHTGRKLTATGLTVAAYVALIVAALARPAADLVPDHYQTLLSIAGGGWIVGFGLFVIQYGPMLLAPRVRADGAQESR
ncbi:MAG TPA: NnrS family protein [Devosia sp.]|nr:NnrS family protein [Devosia sp.]